MGHPCFVLQFCLICVKHAKFVQFCKLHFVELRPEMHKNSLTYLSTVHRMLEWRCG